MKFGCSASPAVIFPGDPVVVTGSALNLSPKSKPVYSWSSNGGTITSNGPTATVATADLAPGEYTVIGHITDGRGTQRQAFCTTPFTVQAYEPPTLACAASPSTVYPGDPVEINCKGKSPQSRPLSYTATSTGGTLTMNGFHGCALHSRPQRRPGHRELHCSRRPGPDRQVPGSDRHHEEAASSAAADRAPLHGELRARQAASAAGRTTKPRPAWTTLPSRSSIRVTPRWSSSATSSIRPRRTPPAKSARSTSSST